MPFSVSAIRPSSKNEPRRPIPHWSSRASGPLALLPSVEKAVHDLDANVPLEKPMSQAAVFEDSYSQPRLFSRLAMFFALLAALLVALGLYGTLSYRVSRKSAEIGVRIALGAPRSQVLYLVLRDSFRIAAIGTAAGIPPRSACRSAHGLYALPARTPR
jgi:predicted lysophospholipase L1 biosynthesis ABC-type transport system permease subunit